jgi:phosphatidate cytidylyltransferase
MILGTIIIAVLVGLCWLDYCAAVPGVWLLPVALVAAVLASSEVLHLSAAAGLRPLPWVVYPGNLLLVLVHWFPTAWQNATWTPTGGMLLALAVGVMAAFVGEMRRFGSDENPLRFPNKTGSLAGLTPPIQSVPIGTLKNPNETGADAGLTPPIQSVPIGTRNTLANLSATIFALIYVGVMLGFVIQLRMTWNVGALASLIIVVKMGDTGAYAFGHAFGRHKMSPRLSPKKTWEGALGQLTFACIASWAVLKWLVPVLSDDSALSAVWWQWLPFGLLIGASGMFGDLAESLIKRTVGLKDSSAWMPGFGGVLDILDSILLAAPVAWACWLFFLA